MTRRLGATSLLAVVVLGAIAGVSVFAVASASPLEVGAGLASDTGPPAQAAPNPVPQTTPEGFDSTVFRVTTYENGSARWTLQYLRLLENDSEVAAFEDYAAEFERTEPEFVQNFQTRAERLTTFGTDATGRNMTATDFRRSAFVRTQIGGAQAVGVVELSFLWGRFAQVREDRVVVSDVFEGGMYIGADQRLVFGHGRNLSFGDGVDPAADALAAEALVDSDTVTWAGEQQFSDARPRVEYVRTGSAGVGTATPGTVTEAPETGTGSSGSGTDSPDAGGSSGDGPSGGTDGQGSGDGGTSLMLTVAVGLLVLLGMGGLAWHTDMLPTETGGEGTTAAPDGPDTPSGTEASPAGTQKPAASPAVSEEELLSDEDRVRTLLERNGGRMKQVDIVDRTEWSKSKVSMLLSEMEDEGEISKLRVGRENIISLSGHEPDAAGSPFDED